MDGQDIFSRVFDFTYFEIAHYIARMIPQKIWDIKNEKLNIYERIMVAAPAIIIQKQILKEFLQDLSIKMQCEIKALYSLTGKRIRTLIQVPMYSKVLIASPEKSFKGIKGIDKLRAIVEANQERESVMKEPEEK